MTEKRAYLLLHFIVLLFGFTAILGKLISYDSVPLVWWRLIIVNIALAAAFLMLKKKLILTRKLVVKLVFVGFIIGLHWVLFFGGIKVSNVSITMIAFSSGTFFTAIIEPLVYKRRFNLSEFIIGLLIMIAIGIIGYNEVGDAKNPILGSIFGVLAALTAALFSTFNGALIKESNSFSVSWIELISASFWLTLAMFLFFPIPENMFTPSTNDIIYLLILGVGCTALPFVLSVEVMKKLTPFTVNLTINLEVVYAIVLGLIIWGESEKMSPTFYIGGALIIGLIVVNQYLKKRLNKTKSL